MDNPHISYRKLLIFCASFRIVTLSMPIALAAVPFVANVLCLLTMYAIVMKNMDGYFTSILLKYLPICSLTILVMLFSVFRGGDFINLTYSLLQGLIWPLVACLIVERDDKSTAGILLFVFLLCYIITSATTIIGCHEFPQASRQLAAGADDNTDEYTINLYHSMNIGGFDFVYNTVLLLPLFIAFLKLFNINVAGHVFTRSKKITLFLVFILFFWAIVSAEYTTAVLFAMASAILLFLPLQLSFKRMTRYLIVFAILFLLTRELLIINKDFIANIFGSEAISERIGSLIDLLSGENSSDDSDIVSRTELWGKSLQCFFNNPVFGSATNGGGHSFILDTLADKGLFALVALIIMYSSLKKKIISPLSRSILYPYYIIVYVYNLVLGFVNPYNGLLIMTFIIPLHYCYFSKYEYSNEQVTPDTY